MKQLRICLWVSAMLAGILSCRVDGVAASRMIIRKDQFQYHSNSSMLANLLAVEDDEEFTMESEISRRILQYNQTYITYGLLQPGRAVCKGPNPAYRSCLPPSNPGPHKRPCTAVYRCERSPDRSPTHRRL